MSIEETPQPRTVNRLDGTIIAAGVLALVFSFVSYYSYDAVTRQAAGPAQHLHIGTLSAWNGFWGWFAALSAIAGSAFVAIEVFAPNVKLPFPSRLAALVAYAVAAVSVVLALFLVPSPSVGFGFTALQSTIGKSGFIVFTLDKGHASAYWLSLIVIIAGFVLSLIRFRAAGGKLPGRLDNTPDIDGPAS